MTNPKDKGLVLVQSFDELRTGMRVVVNCGWCRKREIGILGDEHEAIALTSDGIEEIGRSRNFTGNSCGGSRTGSTPAVGERTVRGGRVFRFAADLDMERDLAGEENPYLEKTYLAELNAQVEEAVERMIEEMKR